MVVVVVVVVGWVGGWVGEGSKDEREGEGGEGREGMDGPTEWMVSCHAMSAHKNPCPALPGGLIDGPSVRVPLPLSPSSHNRA